MKGRSQAFGFRMDVSNLRLFVEVMRLGSFAAVAWDRGMPPSAVSRAIAALEGDLGVRLFQRSGGTLLPTDTGNRYFARVEPLIDELEAAARSVAGNEGTLSGTVRMVAPPTFAQLNVVPLLPHLRGQHASLNIDLVLTDAALDLRAERYDFAVRLGGLPDDSYVSRKLCALDWLVCASPAYLARAGRPRLPVGLGSHDCLRLLDSDRQPTRWRFRSAQSGIQEVPVQGSLAASDVIALRQLALADQGPALLPRWAVARHLLTGKLIDVFPEHQGTMGHFDEAAWIVYPAKRYLTQRVQRVMSWIEDAFRDGPPSEQLGSVD